MSELARIEIRNPNDFEVDDEFYRFWRSFQSWFQGELPETDILQNQYRGYNNWNNGSWYIDINFQYMYNLHLGISYPDILESNNPSIEDVKTFIELIYSEFICKEKRYEFTVSLNKRLEKFKVSYRLQNGCLIKQGYKTSNCIDKKIYNYPMFERKIRFSEEMITSNEILDKKVALDYIIDALQYFVSINAGSSVKDKYKSTAKAVDNNENGKTYTVVKNEIEEIMKIANEFYDIRHNEYLNKSKEAREAIRDGMLIEYLYNRVYALLFLLRIKADTKSLISYKTETEEE